MQEFVDSSGEAGVVYVSLGTVCSIGAEEFWELASALSGLPAHVVWKVSQDDMPAGMELGNMGLGSNVKVTLVAVFYSSFTLRWQRSPGNILSRHYRQHRRATDRLRTMALCIRREVFHTWDNTWPTTHSCLLCRWCGGRHRMICWEAAV